MVMLWLATCCKAAGVSVRLYLLNVEGLVQIKNITAQSGPEQQLCSGLFRD
jgi:hypothetical protein